MFKNYLKIAFRNVWKNKVFSLIHILGLSIGLSAAFVIGAMVFYDLTFDKFDPDADRIYRVTTSFKRPDGEFSNACKYCRWLKSACSVLELGRL